METSYTQSCVPTRFQEPLNTTMDTGILKRVEKVSLTEEREEG